MADDQRAAACEIIVLTRSDGRLCAMCRFSDAGMRAILAHGGSTVGPLLQATRTVPIVFPVAGDPVGAGLVDNLARPGGNATGFMEFEYSLGGKWLELLKQIAPSVTRAAVLRDPSQGSATGQFAAIQAVAPSLRVEVTPSSTLFVISIS